MPHLAGKPNSDFMVDVIKSMKIEHIYSNPASSFRGLHESLIDYGANKTPEFLTCMHEESAVGMAHGYFKASGKPLNPWIVRCMAFSRSSGERALNHTARRPARFAPSTSIS